MWITSSRLATAQNRRRILSLARFARTSERTSEKVGSSPESSDGGRKFGIVRGPQRTGRSDRSFARDRFGFIPAAIPECHLGRVRACCHAARRCARTGRDQAQARGCLGSPAFSPYGADEGPLISDSIRSIISRSEMGASGTLTRSGSRGGVRMPWRARNPPSPDFACQVMPQGERSS